jgi:hypothetical protein
MRQLLKLLLGISLHWMALISASLLPSTVFSQPGFVRTIPAEAYDHSSERTNERMQVVNRTTVGSPRSETCEDVVATLPGTFVQNRAAWLTKCNAWKMTTPSQIKSPELAEITAKDYCSKSAMPGDEPNEAKGHRSAAFRAECERKFEAIRVKQQGKAVQVLDGRALDLLPESSAERIEHCKFRLNLVKNASNADLDRCEKYLALIKNPPLEKVPFRAEPPEMPSSRPSYN